MRHRKRVYASISDIHSALRQQEYGAGHIGTRFGTEEDAGASNIIGLAQAAQRNAQAHIDALRGDDSTGVAALYNDGSIKALKEACPADVFRNTKEWNLFFQSIYI